MDPAPSTPLTTMPVKGRGEVADGGATTVDPATGEAAAENRAAEEAAMKNRAEGGPAPQTRVSDQIGRTMHERLIAFLFCFCFFNALPMADVRSATGFFYFPVT